MYPVLDSSKEQFKRKRNDLKKKLTKFNISFNKAFTSITRISNIYRIKILPQIYITGIYNVITAIVAPTQWIDRNYLFSGPCTFSVAAMIYNHTKPTRCIAIRFLSQILTASCSEFIQDTCILNAKTTAQIWIFIF